MSQSALPKDREASVSTRNHSYRRSETPFMRVLKLRIVLYLAKEETWSKFTNIARWRSLLGDKQVWWQVMRSRVECRMSCSKLDFKLMYVTLSVSTLGSVMWWRPSVKASSSILTWTKCIGERSTDEQQRCILYSNIYISNQARRLEFAQGEHFGSDISKVPALTTENFDKTEIFEC
jgi:hypothetical protein